VAVDVPYPFHHLACLFYRGVVQDQDAIAFVFDKELNPLGVEDALVPVGANQKPVQGALSRGIYELAVYALDVLLAFLVSYQAQHVALEVRILWGCEEGPESLQLGENLLGGRLG
jgi:hypothetical protein